MAGQVARLGSASKVTLKAIQIGRELGDSVEVVAGPWVPDRRINSWPEPL